jgi:magnesium transporter
VQDLRENAESSHFYADELLDDVNNLLHMQLALAGHRTNEVVKVLTVFSAFFLPLTFLVGVYGMNFRYMPELEARWGYPAAWALMLVISLGIYVWFRRRRWL